MKSWFILAIAALLVSTAQAADEETVEKSSDPKFSETFETADIDADGKISKWEFLAFEKKRAKEGNRKFDIKTSGTLFESLDTNKDKALSREEFDQLKTSPTAE